MPKVKPACLTKLKMTGQMVGLVMVLVVLMVTCHWCQARRLLSKKLSRSNTASPDTPDRRASGDSSIVSHV